MKDLTADIFQVGIDGGSLAGQATVDVQVRKGGSAATPIYMGELYQVVNDVPAYTSIATTGTVSGTLPIAVQGTQIIALSGDPHVQFSKSNVFLSGNEVVTFVDLDPLLAYRNFDVADVISGLAGIADFVSTIEGFSHLDRRLPLLNRSVTDLVSFADDFQAAVASLQSAGGVTLQQLEAKLEQAFGVAPSDLTLSMTANDLRVGLRLSESIPAGLRALAMDLDLGALGAGNPDLAGLGHLIDVQGADKLDVDADAALDLNFGFDLSNPNNPRVYIRDDSTLTMTARVSGTDIDFDTALGPLGVHVRNGTARLDNGVGIPASFLVTLDQTASDKWFAGSWSTAIVNASAAGQAHATLPIYYPSVATFFGNIQLDTSNLANIAGTTTLSSPDFAAEIEAINLFGDMGGLIQGIDLLLRSIQSGLETKFAALDLPIIGDALADRIRFVDVLRTELIADLQAQAADGSVSVTEVQAALFAAFGPSGMRLLPAAISNPAQITFTRIDDASGDAERIEFDLDLHSASNITLLVGFDLGLPGLGLAAPDATVELMLDYDMRFGFGVSRSQGVYLKTYDGEDEIVVGVSATLQNAAVGGSLGFLRVRLADDTSEGTHLSGSIGIDLSDADHRITYNELAGGGNAAGLMHLDLDLVAEANLLLVAGAPNVAVSDPAASNFFLAEFPQVEAGFNMRWVFTPGGAANGVLEQAELTDVRMDLGRFFSGFLTPIFDFLDPIVEVARPLIDVLTEPLPVFSELAGGSYTLINLAQDLNGGGNFVSDETLDFLEAAALLFDMVGDISSYGGSGVYLEFGGVDLKGFDLRNPGFRFASFGPNTNPLAGKQIHTPAQSLADQLDVKAPTFAGSKEAIKGKDGSGFDIPLIDNPLRVFDLLLGRQVDLFRYDMPELAFDFSHRWRFGPVFYTPPVFVTLSGGFKAGINFGFGYDTSGLIKLDAQIDAGGPVNPLVVLDGFFVADWDASGRERPEAFLEGRIGAGAEVSAIVVSAGVEGGIYARLGLDLSDPDNDGRMHGSEILEVLLSGGTPICLFDFSGEIGAFLSVHIDVGIWPFIYTIEFDVARVTLIDWTIDLCHEPPPVLATQIGGDLYLNMGSRAADRLHGDIVDDDENFVVKNLADGTVMVEAFGFTQIYGKYKLDTDGELIEFGDSVTRIIADGGAGNDTIEIAANVPMVTDLRGGVGDDVLIAGGGAAFIQGGAGRDVIYGGVADDELYGDMRDGSGAEDADEIRGGAGNDRIFGGGGDDRLYGQEGDDEIHGGTGEDMLFGQAGRDRLYGDEDGDGLFGGFGADRLEGGAGTDYLIGGDAEAGMVDELYGFGISGSDDGTRDYLYGDEGAGLLPEYLAAEAAPPGGVEFGDDLLFGQGGDDVIYGEAGVDFAFGEAGADFIAGGDGDDHLHGGAGDDEIRGGAGADTIEGDAGDDEIRGDQGADVVYGDEGRDTLLGGSDDDVLYGGDDGDFIRGQEGDDEIYGEAGNDDLRGDAGRDLLVGGLGNDLLNGGTQNDRLFGSTGDDTLYGSTGDDVLYGEAGIDALFGNDGDDVLYGGTEADTIRGGDGSDFIYGESGADALFGDAGDDYLDGGTGADALFGGDDDDTLMAGSGLGKELFGDAGNDLIIGTAEGFDDDDLLDGVHTGDIIHGGDGDDRLYGLSGADTIYGDAGDDEIWGGAHGDYLLGGGGFDRIYGGTGVDMIDGGDDDDEIDGGFGADLLLGGAGDDVIVGGGGADEIHGGAGDDVLRGSDDAPDLIRGGVGADRIFGNGGNDALYGDGDDDVIEGGNGDDVLEGGAGSDVLIGGADNDILRGHLLGASPADDDAVDYLYGDFGTNLDDAGAGADRLFGQGGNDLMFGEGGDDLIDAGSGTFHLIDYGAGEGADPAAIGVYSPTPNPVAIAPADEPYALPQLPSGLTPGGRWTEFAGSASGTGVSNSPAAAIEPALAIDAAGNRYVAWADARNGNYEIYVLRYSNAGGWEMLAGSAEGRGISATLSDSRRPTIAIGADGNPIVAWTERVSTAFGISSNIRAAEFDPTANGGVGAWIALGDSLDAAGLSGTGAADDATILITSGGPVVTWLDGSSGTTQVYARRFFAGAWSAFGTSGASGGGATQAPSDVAEYAAATDGTEVAITYSRLAGSDYEVYLARSNGGAWVGLAGSTTGGGLSDNAGDSRHPTVAYHDGTIFVAWQDQSDLHQEIYARYFDGALWARAGDGAADGQGVSATTGIAAMPQLAVRSNDLYLAWIDHSAFDRPDNEPALYLKRWTGTRFAAPSGDDAANRGISPTARHVQSFSLALDASGRPFLAWDATDSGASQVYLRGNLLANATVYQVGSMDALQGLLDSGTLGTGDVVVLASGNYAGTLTIDADDAGVTIVGDGALDTVITGRVDVVGTSGVTLQRLNFAGGVETSATTSLTLVDNRFGDTGLTISGGSDLRILHNRFDGTVGITLAGAASGRITRNDIAADGTGIVIGAPFGGLIDHNDIHGGDVGVAYNAAAMLSANRIRDNDIGVRSTVGGADALGFVAGAVSNEIFDNRVVGIELVAARVQDQHVYENPIGIRGSGTVGGATLDRANRIESNSIGIDGFTGTVQFNRIAQNGIGIRATAGLVVQQNLIYRNDSRGLSIVGVADVRVNQNTFYAPVGDNIRLSAGASNVEIRGNILWAETGYDIYVANDSQTGFFSDYNDLYVTGSGRIGYWTKDFTDILDWQADIARFDLHSIGHTDIDPAWARPRFVNLAQDDYRLFQPVAALRFTSPTIDASDARLDGLRPASETNLLVNPGFEAGLGGWTTNVGAAIRSATPNAFEGASYFTGGSIEEGYAEQLIDLLAKGYTAAELDQSDLEVVFSGRLRSAVEAAADQGKLVVTFLSSSATTLGTIEAAARNESARWELVGGRADIPVGTRSIVLRFVADRETGTTNDAFFDHAFLGIVSENAAPDLGAYGRAATDLGLVATPRINLRFPDLYTDWEKDKPLVIRWETFGNTVDSPVRIDLYQDGPAGPAPLATIAAATADDGEFIWIPATSGIDFGTYDLRIRVALNANPLVHDMSTETFTVPEDGQNYWVDDGSNANDEYTPGAIGDNRNTGKLATAPKPNPVNLVRTYALNAAAMLYIDTGTYPLINPLSLSGTFDLGLGLDEGFGITGPESTARTALLLPAIPGDRTRPLIFLNDADFVTVRHLSFESALRGLDVGNGSDGFSASWLTAYGHAEEGIRITTESPFADFEHLTAYDNGREGIEISGTFATFSEALAYGNGDSGISLAGGFTLVRDSVAYDNGSVGIRVQANAAGARVEGNAAYDNRTGISVTGGGSGAPVVVGNDDLSLGRGNLAYGNSSAGFYASGNVRVVGNTARDQGIIGSGITLASDADAVHNVVFGNRYGIEATSGGDVRENRVYANRAIGIVGGASEGFVGNAVYSNPTNIRVDGETLLLNNLVYDSEVYGVYVLRADGSRLVNNTIVAAQGDAIRIENRATDVELRNNIISVANGYGVWISAESQTGFASDYNLFHVSGSGDVGFWQGADRTTLTAWRDAIFGDRNSLYGDPLFVDPDGSDGVLGYVSPANDGRDDDYHLRSQFGSFKAGSLVPVFDAASGLPEFLPSPAATSDGSTSPAIDRGAPVDGFSNEPADNGGYVNIGAYGNTSQASKSPAQYMLVTNPNGGEALPQESTFEIRWRADGFDGNVAIDVAHAGGALVWETLAGSEINDGSYLWSVDPARFGIDDDYLVRVRALVSDSIQDESDGPFAITAPISVYYVNDNSLVGDQYTMAIGNDANDGLTAATPKASIRSVVETYDLELGDVILVDTGMYALTANIVLGVDDSGVAIEGPTAPGARAVLNRGNTGSNNYVIELTGADDVTLRNLAITGAQYGIFANINAGSDRLTVESSELYGNSQGAYVRAGNFNAVFDDNDVYRNSNNGLQIEGAGSLLIGNNVWGNSTGISTTNNTEIARVDVVGNLLHDNSGFGVIATHWVYVADNTAYGNGVAGVQAAESRALVENNEVYLNATGIDIRSQAIARGNTVYANSGIGIVVTALQSGTLTNGGTIERNTVFDNNVGIQEYNARVAYNLVYDNVSAGIAVAGGHNLETEGILSNTVVQPTGTAIRLVENARDVRLRDNILEVAAGYAIEVPVTAQENFASDYNLFSLVGTGKVGFWNRGYSSLSDWIHEIGTDSESLVGDPQFVDSAGADGVRGYSAAAVGAPLIIDDGDAGFSVVGTWTTLVGATGPSATTLERTIFNNAWGQDILQIPGGGDGTGVARWSFDGVADGTYLIAARWPTGSGLSGLSTVQYRAYDGAPEIENAVAYASINQFNGPNDFIAEGYAWERLDTVTIRNGRLVVELSDIGGSTSNRFTADAILVQRIDGNRSDDDDFRLGAGSVAIDRADPAGRYEQEPVDNGNRADLGAFGNSTRAAPSAAQTVQVLSPNGMEKLESGAAVRIDVLTAGLAQFEPTLVMNLGGGAVGNWVVGDPPASGGSNGNSMYGDPQVLDLSAPNAGPEGIYLDFRTSHSGVNGAMEWTFAVPDGQYVVRLHFIEANNYSAGQRRFDVSLQGAVVDANLDIFARAGRNKALVLEHVVSAEDGAGIALLLKNLTSVGATIAGIELLRTNPDGVAAPTVDLETSIDAGATWTMLASGLDVDRYGRVAHVTDALPQANAVWIRATAHAGNVSVQDISDAPFQVSNAGNAYYVNDDSLAGDEYATAIGNDANDGKTAATPMATLGALLRAYDLDPGDVIYVDSGSYLLQTNVVLEADDSGVVIRGPVLTGHAAVLDRGDTGSTVAYVFELNGADDVVIDHLDMTGARYGVHASTDEDSDRVTVSNAKIYGHEDDGIFIAAGTAEAFTIRDSEVFDNGEDGIDVNSRSGRILNNLVHGNDSGIFAVGSNDMTVRILVSGNLVRDNTAIGIESTGGSIIELNTVHDNDGNGIVGVSSSLIHGNVVHGNRNGIFANGATVEDNRVFGHTGNGTSTGIGIQGVGTVRGNQVYGNVVGIDFNGQGEVRGNVVYGNTVSGIDFAGNLFSDGVGVLGNTIYQMTGDALVVSGGSNVVVRDNILVAGAGYAIRVASSAQVGFESDYNLFWLTGTGKVAFWEDRGFANLLDWALEVGFDLDSLVADPRFVDIDGADDLLGLSAGVDRGADDDFRVRADSPAVDRGDPRSRYDREPPGNGARVDIGAYGNTVDAVRSPAQTVQVLSPNGAEKFERGQDIAVDVHTSGLTLHDPVLLMRLGGVAVEGYPNWLAPVEPEVGIGGSLTFNSLQTIDSDVPNAAPEAVYRNYYWSSEGLDKTTEWHFDVPDGAYTVRLHFVEPTATAGGQRVFEVDLQGAIVESGLDVFSATGTSLKALVRDYAITAESGEGVSLLLRNLTSQGAVITGIEILRPNVGGVANATADLEASGNGGATWIPIAGGVALDRYGNASVVWNAGLQSDAVLIRATARAGTTVVSDVSDAPFQIANAGNAYYVNDASLVGDEYATAIGNNANNGKSAASPMASLAALLRTYDLDPGDVVYVDTGTYSLTTNIVLDAEDSGVTLRGPVLPGHEAVLDRGNTATGAAVIQLRGASDVTLEHLSLAGAQYGVIADGTDGNDRIVLRFTDVYGNTEAGIAVTAGQTDWVIADSRIHNNTKDGIRIGNGQRVLVERNELFGNTNGVLVSGLGSPNNPLVVNNDVHDNSAIGISASGSVVIRGNRVYNHSGAGDVGILSTSGLMPIEDNDVYGNATGISVASAIPVTANRVYDNGIGIRSSNGIVSRNQIYSNSTGIVDASRSSIFANLVYANTNFGIDVTGGHTAGALTVYGNTVWQDTGSAIRLSVDSNARLRNNIVSIGTGYAIDVAVNGQTGFSSDWNLFDLRTANAQVGRWGTTQRATLADWQSISANHDVNAKVADPAFLDIDGADNVLGDQDVTTGDGYDDNFGLDADSPAIDAASAYDAPLVDIEGRERWDDVSTANTGIGWDRFVESVPGGSSFALTGTRITISGVNGVATVALPFAFEFYGTVYNSVTATRHGYLHFGGLDAANVGDDNSQEVFLRNIRIAPLWDNLQFDSVYVDTTVAEQVTIRWAATRQDPGGGVVNFSTTLFANGNVRFDYGSGNRSLDPALGTLTPTVGLSAGNGVTFVLSQYNGAADLGNVASVLFTPNEGLTYFDIGAYEFLGDSGDVTAPTVTSVSQLPAPNGSTAAAFSSIQIGTSEALNSISAKSPANYDLRREGVDGMFDTADDVIVPLRPLYSFPETSLTLEFLLGANGNPGILPEGDYRLTLSGTAAIYDLAGNPLDGNADGIGGDDYVRHFTIDRSLNVEPVANAQTLNVLEDGEITITLSASDANGDPLAYALTAAPSHGTLSNFNPSARTVVYRPDAGYTGTDSFGFIVDDGNAGIGTATINLVVQPVNDAPSAQDQAVTLDEDTSRLIVLSGADSETARPDLVFSLVTAPLHGTLVQGAGGGWTYTPNADYVGDDSFTYTVRDRGDPDGVLANAITSAPATVSLTVVGLNDAPQIGEVAPQVVLEGSTLLVDLDATDVEGHALTWSLDAAPAGLTIDPVTGLIAWSAADGDENVFVTARVMDAGTPAMFDTVTFEVSVRNIAPTLTVTGAPQAAQGQPYVLVLDASDPGDDTVIAWEIDWGDGYVDTVDGDASSAQHVYALGGSGYEITARAVDEDGSYEAAPLNVEVTHGYLTVTGVTATSTGFHVGFDRAFDASVINLYTGEPVDLGAADVVLTGAATGVVRGSLVFDADREGFTFIKTGGVLAADSYTVSLRSADDGFRSVGGVVLDGNGDDVLGGDYAEGFTVAPSTAPVLSIADFARGNAQVIDVPAYGSGLPIRLSDGTGVNSVGFVLRTRADAPWTVSDVELAPGLPAGTQLSVDPTNAQAIAVTVSLPAGETLGSGAKSLVVVRAQVNADAEYGDKQILDLTDIAVNGAAGGAIDDDGIHVVALFGDTSGNRAYSTLDVQRLQRVSVRYDTGFAAFPNADPLLIGDINGSGGFSAIDVTRLLQEVNYVAGVSSSNRPEIPAIPAGVAPLALAGADPTVDLPKDVAVRAGETFTVPVRLDNAAELESAQLRLNWDGQALELVSVNRGSLTGDFQWYVQRQGEGELYVDMSRLTGLASGSGSVLELTFKVAGTAQPGVVDLDLSWVSLNEGRLTLTPLPQPGPDGSDGAVTIAGPVTAPSAARPGLLSALGTVLKRVLWQTGAVSASEAVEVSSSPLLAVAARVAAPGSEAVRTLPQVALGGSKSVGSTPVPASGESGTRGWVKQFVSTPAAKAIGANAALRVTVPPTTAAAAHPVTRDPS